MTSRCLFLQLHNIFIVIIIHRVTVVNIILDNHMLLVSLFEGINHLVQ